jgi:hypothetical protein
MKIAIAIIIQNEEEKNINKCLNSLKNIENKKIYYTSTCDFKNKALSNCNEIKPINSNICENKNNLIKNIKEDWILSIEPWEEVINGHKSINQIINNEKESHKVMVIDNEIINKSIRIFKKNNFFQNEIYEEIYDKKSKVSSVVFKKNEYFIEKEKEKIENWVKKNKTNPKPYYYLSCYYLKNKEYIEFKKTSEKYLFLEENKTLPSIVMTKYYQSLVNLHIYKDYKGSINDIIYCLANNPSMAEFWCMLADINFKLNKHQKAIYFYENAIMFGEKRKSDDEFSIEVKKYKTYPEQMINKCKELIN